MTGLGNFDTFFGFEKARLREPYCTNATGRETSSSWNLQMKLDSLTEALDNLNAAHTVWKPKAELTDEQLSGEVF